MIGGSGVLEHYRRHYKETHTIEFTIKGFGGLRFDRQRFPFIFVETEPKVYILKRQKVISVVTSNAFMSWQMFSVPEDNLIEMDSKIAPVWKH